MHGNSKPITEYHISDTQERMPVPAAKTNHSRTSGNNTTADVLGTKRDEDASEHNEEMETPEVFFTLLLKSLQLHQIHALSVNWQCMKQHG